MTLYTCNAGYFYVFLSLKIKGQVSLFCLIMFTSDFT